jgi:phospholipid transport system substrate-binding protein
MRFQPLLTGLLFLTLLCPLGVMASTSPSEDISKTVDQLLVVLRNNTLDKAQRRQQLSNLIRDRFEFETMSQSTLGKHWKNATPQQQQRFMDLFSDLLEETYIGRIEAYTDETVIYGDEKIRSGKALVSTSISTKTVVIPIDYKLVETNKGWYVYDVVIEGVSLVRNFRSSYGTILDREGFDSLFAQMETKLTELRQ